MKRSIITILLAIILSAFWGSIQTYIFPKESFGDLCYFTAFVGGALIGLIISIISEKFRNYERKQ